ncbi:TatD family hydrolase [Desertivirga brevis]|uniref:TatD family hydrolase n=1 Tax=Desertivirga brevis TaxID=2810310 RepID=UPI001A97B9B1|nr:TatD family hydrolase [Pedobacter sp. SYSU D00873]
MYLNFHTHFSSRSPEVQSLQNIIVGKDDLKDVVLRDGYGFSAGIHPWYLEADFERQLQMLQELSGLKQVQVIGECGLDRIKGPELSLQQKVFEAQIKLAECVRKPMVIHCVKCFSELLEIKKRLNPTVPMVLHGFNNKVEAGIQMFNAGFWFSFGGAINREGSNAGAFLERIPLNRVFLETDDSEIGIEKVYEAAADIRKITLDDLKEIIFANWMSLLKEARNAP